MDERRQQIDGFLAAAGWQDAKRAPLAGDASPRKYERLWHEGSQRCAVLMDAPNGSGSNTPQFLQIGRHLKDLGFSAPEIYAADEDLGLVLLEDLGDELYARICTTDPATEQQIYEAAVDLLTQLHLCPLPSLPPYSSDIYVRESLLVTEWYLPALSGQQDQRMSGELSELIRSACARIEGDHSCLVLRDYHAENLLWLPDRSDYSRVGLLDFQDGLIGHPAYDLVSLLEDARRDTSKELREEMFNRFAKTSDLDTDALRYAYATLGAQRNLKIVGIFARLCRRDGKPGYVEFIPRVWEHLMRDLQHPELKELRDFVSRVLPVPSADRLQRIKGGAS